MHIKKGDQVVVRSGKDRGRSGKVLKVLPRAGRAVVEGVGERRRHERPRRAGAKGEVVTIALPVAASTLALWCRSCGRGVRTGAKVVSGKKQRYCRRCQREI